MENVSEVTEHTNAKEDDKFTVLNAQRDLEQQLVGFKKACDAHDKHRRKRCKRRYYNLGLMAKVACHTTAEELKRLLKNGTKTLLIDTVTNKTSDVEKMALMISAAVAEQQAEEPFSQFVVGLALEITGDCCRLGRIRNNCSLFMENGGTITLTTDISYKYSGFKEICYVINLHYYLHSLQFGDEIKIGHEVRGRIVKKLKDNIAIQVEDAGIINSYEWIEVPNQCYSQQQQTLANMFNRDLELAAKVQADFVVIPRIHCIPLLKALRYNLKDNYCIKLIGTIDLDYANAKMLDIRAIIKLLDFLWLPNIFNLTETMHSYVCRDVIPIAKCLRKPLIGSVPLERCSEFRVFENHDVLWKIDCIFIEKSAWCNKYPLIVKKLLPIKDYRRGVVENAMALREILTSYQSAVNFIIRTISSIECQAIFVYSKCESAAAAFARVEIYCPVYVLLPLEDIDNGDDSEMLRRIQLAKVFNLRRNLRSIIYSKEMNEFEYKPIDFGIEYARASGSIATGDFVITIQVGKEGGEDGVQLGVGEDVVIMRAFYVAQTKVGEKFKCH